MVVYYTEGSKEMHVLVVYTVACVTGISLAVHKVGNLLVKVCC